MARLLLDHGDIDRRELGSVRNISVGGAPASRELLAELDAAFGCETICGYGMTEAGPTLTRSLAVPGRPSSLDQRATTGRPILGVDARVLGPDDVEVPWDGQTVGEICARSNHVLHGYLAQPQATPEAPRAGAARPDWTRVGKECGV